MEVDTVKQLARYPKAWRSLQEIRISGFWGIVRLEKARMTQSGENSQETFRTKLSKETHQLWRSPLATESL